MSRIEHVEAEQGPYRLLIYDEGTLQSSGGQAGIVNKQRWESWTSFS